MDNLKKQTVMKRLLIFTLLLSSCLATGAQDLRTLESKVADLLAAMPVHNTVELDKRMQEMKAMGPAGRKMITAMIIPPGGGDDTKARFAVESYSRYLSSYGHNIEKAQWEEECIDAIHASGYRMVRSFFLSQLKYTGSERAVEFASGFITDKNLCRDALAVIAASDYPGKEEMLVAALQIESLPCPAAVLNELADLGSRDAVTGYLEWYTRGDEDVKKAALNAMAESAHPLVSDLLLSAAKEVDFKWDAGGATAALVQYARNMGDKGAVEEMDELCGIVISNGELQYRVAALEAMVHYKGYGAIGYLLTEYGRGSREYRHAIFELSYDIPGKAATRRWMEVYPRVNEIGKAELITMLGERGDMIALPLVKDALFCPSQRIRTSSAQALVKLQGRDAVPELIDYIQSYETAGDQEAGYRALRTVTDSRRRDMIARALEGSGDMTKSTMILLLSSGGNNKYFNTVYKYCSSDNDQLRRVAVSELKRLAGPSNQDQLISLMLETDDADEIKELQPALVEAASMVSEKENRAAEVLKAMAEHGQQEKFIPVLAKLGGKKALNTVLKEFDKGDAEMRRIAFDGLTAWTDHSASGALYDICASGNKNYSDPAFFAYVEKVAGSPLNDKQRYERLTKIMPYAFTPQHEESIIRAMGSVRTESALMFLAPYLENDELKQVAAASVIAIVLPETGEKPVFTGTDALKLLKKAEGIIEDPESH